MKRSLALIFLALAASSTFGQGRTIVSGTIADPAGAKYAGASLTATLSTPTGTVGAYLNGVQIAGSVGPVQLDLTGSFLMSLPDNTLVQCANAVGQIVACNPQTQWNFAVTLSPGVPPPVGTGPQTCPATITISGSSQTVSSSFVCPLLLRPVTAGAGGTTGQSQVNNGGVLAGTPCETFPNLSTGPVSVNCDWHPKGPNPGVDITLFGARPVNPNSTPAAVGLTATCTGGLFTCTVSAASFLNGDGVIIYGAGAPGNCSTAPTIASVTPSVSLAGTATLHTTPGPTGATTYNYKMLARDRAGCVTAASAAVSTTTGAASLGAQTVAATSWARSGRTVTATLSAAHGFLVGCSVGTCGEGFSGAGVSDATFRGWFSVTSAVDSTHFTFISGPDTTLGATTSATGGGVTYYNSNTVCASSLPAGAVELYLTSDRATPGTFALVAAGYPNSATGTQDLCLDDYGSPMMDNQAFPPFITAAAPWASATSDHLSTTVASGGGTTSLTLANAIGTTVTNATIRLDAAPGIQAAAAQARLTSGTVQIPIDPNGGQFVLNSWLKIGSGTSIVTFSQAGNLYLNDTFEIDASTNSGGNQYIGNIMPISASIAPPSAWGDYPVVNINTAHPGFFFSSGSQNALHASGLQLASIPVNGTVEMVAEGGFNQTFDHINFASGTGANDYISMGLMLKASPGQSNSNVVADFVSFAPGGGGDGVSHTPVFWCRGCGTTAMPRYFSVHRGIQFEGTTLSLGDGGVTYINGGGTPLVTTFGPFVNVHFNGTVVLDTFAHPCITALTTGTSLALIEFKQSTAAATTCQPSSGVLGVSGNYGGLLGFSNPTFANSIGPSIFNAGAFIYQVSQLFNAYVSIDPNHSAFVRAATLAAPTCAVSAGGTLPVGGYSFQIAPSWLGATPDPASPSSSTCTTTSGNQTVTVNWTAAPGNPTGYSPYTNGLLQRQTSGAGSVCAVPLLPAGTTSWVLASPLLSCSGPPNTVPTGGPTEFASGAQGVSTDRLTINGNCSSSASPAVCGSSATGSVTIAAGATTVTVNTTAVTANSQIELWRDDSLGAKLGVTCNTATVMGEIKTSTRVAGTSFTITVQTAPVTNPGCLSFSIVN